MPPPNLGLSGSRLGLRLRLLRARAAILCSRRLGPHSGLGLGSLKLRLLGRKGLARHHRLGRARAAIGSQRFVELLVLFDEDIGDLPDAFGEHGRPYGQGQYRYC